MLYYIISYVCHINDKIRQNVDTSTHACTSHALRLVSQLVAGTPVKEDPGIATI